MRSRIGQDAVALPRPKGGFDTYGWAPIRRMRQRLLISVPVPVAHRRQSGHENGVWWGHGGFHPPGEHKVD